MFARLSWYFTFDKHITLIKAACIFKLCQDKEATSSLPPDMFLGGRPPPPRQKKKKKI
jgi:hypothetical protein